MITIYTINDDRLYIVAKAIGKLSVKPCDDDKDTLYLNLVRKNGGYLWDGWVKHNFDIDSIEDMLSGKIVLRLTEVQDPEMQDEED